MPSSLYVCATGAVSKTYASYLPLRIRSTMSSNMADSSKEGFVVAISINGSTSTGMSANLRNWTSRSLISPLYLSMVDEMSISSTIERYKGEIKDRLVQFLKFADIPVDVEPFIEIATTNPSFEESAMFDDMVDLILSGQYDAYVFDTAPVAHTYRLLGMSKVYNLWLNKMIKIRQEAKHLMTKL